MNKTFHVNTKNLICLLKYHHNQSVIGDEKNVREQVGAVPLHTPTISTPSSFTQDLVTDPCKMNPLLQECVATVPSSKLGDVSVA